MASTIEIHTLHAREFGTTLASPIGVFHWVKPSTTIVNYIRIFYKSFYISSYEKMDCSISSINQTDQYSRLNVLSNYRY